MTKQGYVEHGGLAVFPAVRGVYGEGRGRVLFQGSLGSEEGRPHSVHEVPIDQYAPTCWMMYYGVF